MLQTLDDMLADQKDRYGRGAVWLRIAWELPVNIIEEHIHNKGEISVNKLSNIRTQTLVYAVLAVFIIGGFIASGLLWRQQRQQIASLKSEVRTLSDVQAASYGGSYYAATIAPSEKAVYLPLANLKLPATQLSQTLVYDYEPEHKEPGIERVFNAQLSISTHALSNNHHSTTRQFDCSEVVYADFVTPSYPMNPKWKLSGKATLADGRTMNVYYAPSIPGCDVTREMNGVDPGAIAQALLQASSY